MNLNITGVNITNISYAYFGNNSVDTYLYRSAASVLTLNSHLIASGGWVNSTSINVTNIYLSDDVQLLRGAANRLDLASGDSFNLVSGAISIGGTNVIDSSRNVIASTWVNGTNFNVTNIYVSDDTQLLRGAANRLDLASGDSFNLVSGSLLSGGLTVIDSSRNINGTWINGTNLNASVSLYAQSITEAGTTLANRYVSRTDWTTIDNYPTGCSAGQFATTIGDTLTCSFAVSVNNMTGFGIAGYIPQWANGTALNNSNIFQLGGNVGIGTTSPTQKLQVIGSVTITNGTLRVEKAQPSYDGSDDGLILYLPFSEGNGSSIAYDRSPYGNDGILNMNLTGNLTSGWNATDCSAGYCLKFDGINDYVGAGNGASLNITSTITIEAWIKPNSFIADPDASTIVTKAGPYFQLNGSGYVRAWPVDEYFISTNPVLIGQWQHVAFTYDGQNVTIYINGIIDSIYPETGSITPNTNHLGIGMQLSSSGTPYTDYERKFNGSIDEVRIYNRSLMTAEVRRHYLNGLNATATPYVSISGNVGIGTTSPGSYKLNVIGDINASWGNFTNVDVRSTFNAPNVVSAGGWVNSSNLNVTNNAYIGGNVGIGTTSPTQKLEVVGGINSTSWINGTNLNASVSLYAQSITEAGTTLPNKYVSRTDWTTIDNYPTGCSAGQTVQTVGDTLTCVSTVAVNNITGFGISGYIPQWANGTALNNSNIFQLGNNVGIGTTSPGNYKLNVIGDINASWGNFSNVNISSTFNAPNVVSAGGWVNSSNLNVTRDIIAGNITLSNSLYQNIYGSDDGLIGYWSFSEGSGSIAYDKSPYGNDGTLTNMNTDGNATSGWNKTDCKAGWCMRFDGINDIINVSNPSNFNFGTNDFSYSVWIKADALVENRAIMEKALPSGNHRFSLVLLDNIVDFRVCVDPLCALAADSSPISVGQWYHFVGVRDGPGSVKLYRDGVLVGSDSQASINPNVPDEMLIGSWATSGRFNGTIDEVRVYNRSLSTDEIRTQYLGGLQSHGVIIADKFRIVNTSANKIFEVNRSALQYDGSKFYIDSSGNVGIGTASPNQKLEVVGGINSTSWINGTNLNASVSLYAQSITEGGTALSSKYTPQTRTLTAGSGLTGGGDLSADRTFTVSAGGGLTVDATADTINLSSTAAGTGLAFSAGVLSVNTASGLTTSGDDVVLDSAAAGTGLAYATGVLSVNTGNGLTTSGDNIVIDTATVPQLGDAETITGAWTFDGNVRINSNLQVAGNITYVNSQTINVNGSMVPPIDNTFDLGNATLRWRDINGTRLFQGANQVVDTLSATTDETTVSKSGGTVTIGIADPLIVSKGGTGAASLTDGGILLGSGTGAVTVTAQPTNGQLLIGSTGADPVLATLTGTTNQITVTNGAGSITLSTPQDIATGSTPTFAGLITTGNIHARGATVNATHLNASSWINGTNLNASVSLYAQSITEAGTTLPNKYVSRTDWTTIDNYPTGCSAGQTVQTVGDTLTCVSTVAVNNITGFGISGYIPQWANGTALNNSNIFQLGNNVGIGTTSPSTKLEVAGAVNITQATGTSLNVSDTLYVDAGNKRVGIGTVAPTEKLDVNGTIAIKHPAMTVKGSLQESATTNGITSIYVSGKYAYITSYFYAYPGGALCILDITRPSAPATVGCVSTGAEDTPLANAKRVVVAGKYAYVGHGAGSPPGDGLSIVDISIPSSPRNVSYLSIANPEGIAVSGKYLYSAAGAGGTFQVTDISNPLSPRLAASLSITGSTNMDVSGDYAYVTSSTLPGIWVINITNPESPSIASNLTSNAYLTNPYGIYVSGRYAYVTSSTNDTLAVVRISNPASLSITGTITDSTNLDGVNKVVVAGKYAYVTAPNQNRTTIVDVSNPSSPTIAMSLKDDTNFYSTESSQGLFVSGKYLYVGGSTNANPPVDYFTIIDLAGADFPTASIGDIASSNILVSERLIADKIYAQSGLNVGPLGIKSDGHVSFGNNTLVTMPSGNVGIGTASPQSLLHISGSNNNAMLNISNGTNSVLFVNGTLERVGIGTTSPGNYKLNVIGDINASWGNFTNVNISSTFNAPNVVSAGGWVNSSNLNVTNNAYIGGNVGIGTVSPVSKLQINYTDAGSNQYIQLPVNITALAATDCDSPSEWGRMIVDNQTSNLRIHFCVNNGWRFINFDGSS